MKLNEVPVKIGVTIKVSRTVKETIDKVTVTIQAVIPKAELAEREISLESLDALTDMLGAIFKKNKNTSNSISSLSLSTQKVS